VCRGIIDGNLTGSPSSSLPGTAALQVIFIRSLCCLCKREWGRDVLFRIELADAHRSITAIRVDILLVLATGPEGVDAHSKELDRDPLLLADALPEQSRHDDEVVSASETEQIHRIERLVWPHTAAVDRRGRTFFLLPTPIPSRITC
jgi:hypothetical protein